MFSLEGQGRLTRGDDFHAEMDWRQPSKQRETEFQKTKQAEACISLPALGTCTPYPLFLPLPFTPFSTTEK